MFWDFDQKKSANRLREIIAGEGGVEGGEKGEGERRDGGGGREAGEGE